MKMCYNQSIGSVRYKLLVQKITNSFHEPVIQTSLIQFNLLLLASSGVPIRLDHPASKKDQTNQDFRRLKLV